MNILLYSHYFYPSIGGLEIHSEIIAKILVEAGYTVTVVTAIPLNNNKEIENDYKIIRKRDLPTLIKLISKVDLVIVNGAISVPVGIASFFTHKPLIVIHNMAGPIIPPARSFAHKLSNYIRPFLINHTSLHLGVSQACLDSKHLKTSLPQKVLYNPIHPALIEYREQLKNESPDSHKKYDLLYAGRVIEGKGVFVLAEALLLLDNEHVSLTVCISGNGDALPILKEKLKNLKFVKVHFQDFVSGKELAKTFYFSKTLVLPSTTHLEGSPLSIVEAFAFGLPAIGSDQATIKELIKDAGYIFESGNVQQLKEKILILVTNSELYSSLSSSAFKISENFLYSDYKAKFINTINQIKL